jgi:glycosyl transferase family 25
VLLCESSTRKRITSDSSDSTTSRIGSKVRNIRALLGPRHSEASVASLTGKIPPEQHASSFTCEGFTRTNRKSLMSTEILVINLDRSADRLLFQQHQMTRLGLKFSRLKAVDGNEISDETFRRLAFRWQRPLSRTEVACLLSHAKAWQRALDLGQSVLVLEDDAVLSERLPAFLSDLTAYPQDFGIVHLGVRPTGKYVSKSPVAFLPESKTELFDLYENQGGSYAYLLHPSAAGILLSRLAKNAAIADAYLNNTRGIHWLQTDPALAAPDDWVAIWGGEPEKTFATTIFRPNTAKDRADFLLRQGAVLLLTPKYKLRRLAGNISLAFRKIPHSENGSQTRNCPLPVDHASGPG